VRCRRTTAALEHVDTLAALAGAMRTSSCGCTTRCSAARRSTTRSTCSLRTCWRSSAAHLHKLLLLRQRGRHYRMDLTERLLRLEQRIHIPAIATC
jgi:hypothetical protein